jgi:hypothetical protein
VISAVAVEQRISLAFSVGGSNIAKHDRVVARWDQVGNDACNMPERAIEKRSVVSSFGYSDVVIGAGRGLACKPI